MTRPFEPHDDPDIDPVWKWFEFQIAILGEARGRVVRSIRSVGDIVREAHLPSELQFIGFTRGEVEEFFDAQRAQLERLTMFELLATTEAILRIDFNNRVLKKRQDSLSRRFRDIHKAHGDKVRLEEDILGAMKDEGMPATVVAAFRGVLKLRHWLAHGRYWNPKLGRGYAPNDVFDISRALIESIPPS